MVLQENIQKDNKTAYPFHTLEITHKNAAISYRWKILKYKKTASNTLYAIKESIS